MCDDLKKVGSMSQVSNHYQPNYLNALGTAVIGGAGWGAGQYFIRKKPFVSNEGFIHDSFVKRMEDALVEIKDSSVSEVIEHQKNVEKEIDALKDNEALKEFIKSRKDEFKSLSDDGLKELEEGISKLKIEENKSLAKTMFKSGGKYYQFFDDTLNACYDANGKLSHDASKISQEKFNAIKKIIKNERVNSALKSAGIFAAVAAVSCCLFEYFLAKKN